MIGVTNKLHKLQPVVQTHTQSTHFLKHTHTHFHCRYCVPFPKNGLISFSMFYFFVLFYFSTCSNLLSQSPSKPAEFIEQLKTHSHTIFNSVIVQLFVSHFLSFKRAECQTRSAQNQATSLVSCTASHAHFLSPKFSDQEPRSSAYRRHLQPSRPPLRPQKRAPNCSLAQVDS